MKIMSVLITVILYGRMIEIYAYCSVSLSPLHHDNEPGNGDRLGNN